MNQSVVVQLSELILVIIIILAIGIIFMASLYDWRVVARRRYFLAIIAKLRKPRQPQVTVLVYAQGNQATIEACLNSIFRSRYHNYDVVVIDNRSRDGTWQTVHSYRSQRPKSNLYFYSKRKTNNRLIALQQGYQKSQKGDIVFTISASSIMAPNLIKQVVARFVVDAKLDALCFNEASDLLQTFSSLTAHFMRLSRHVYEKSTSLLHIGFINIGQLNVVFRRAVFDRAIENTNVNYQYAADLVITTPDLTIGSLGVLQQVSSWWLNQPVGSRADQYRQNHDFRRLTHRLILNFSKILIVFSPLLMTYFLYIAATLQSNTPLTISWAVVTAWFLLSILSDETSKMIEKIGLIFCLPVVYFFVYVYLVAFDINLVAHLFFKAVKFWVRSGNNLIILVERLAW